MGAIETIYDLKGNKVKEGDILFYSEISLHKDNPKEYHKSDDVAKFNFFIDNKNNIWQYTYADSILEVIGINGVLYTRSLIIRDLEYNFIKYKDEEPIELKFGLGLCTSNSILIDAFIIDIDKEVSPYEFMVNNDNKLLQEMADLKIKENI